MIENIKVEYVVIDSVEDAYQIFKCLDKHKLMALDIEVASKYTKEHKQRLKKYINMVSEKDRLDSLKILKSNGLSYPSVTVTTHIQLAWSKDRSVVFITLDDDLRKLVIDYIFSREDVTWIMHSAQYDMYRLYYESGKMLQNVEDTKLMFKCMRNNCQNSKAVSGLKHLMVEEYGEWSLAKDDKFTLEDAYSEDMLRYSAIDPCATYLLYSQLKEAMYDENII